MPAPTMTPAPGAPPTQERRRGALASLYDRFAHLIHELGKFGVVGALTFAVDLGVFNLCKVVLHLGPLTSQVISVTIAATLAFIGNRFWTWADRGKRGLHREYALYFLFNAVGLGIGLACLGLSHYVLGEVWPIFKSNVADNISAKGFGMVFGTLFRFWAYRRWVFPDNPPSKAAQ